MRSVPAVVTGGVELVGFRADDSSIGAEHLIGADELVVASKSRIERVVRVVAEFTRIAARRRRVGLAGGVGIRERRMFRPDAGVDDLFPIVAGIPARQAAKVQPTRALRSE